MKVIKLNNEEVKNIRYIGSYVKVEQDEYTPVGDETISSEVSYIEEMHRQNIIDYVTKRSIYKFLSHIFDTATEDLKNKIVVNHAIDMQTIFMYYLSKGMTMEEAQYEIMRTKATQILNSTNCHKKYLKSETFFTTMMLYLTPLDVERFTNDSLTLFELYERIALYGKKYGDKTTGVMDFIESYDIYENHGLLDYQLNPGMTYDSLIVAMRNILMNGMCE